MERYGEWKTYTADGGTDISLEQIWQIADVENRGLLTPAGFGIVLRLIGYAQAGRPVSAGLAIQRE